MKWLKNIVYNYKIELETGLHIGGLKDTVKIGGTDSPVFKTYKRYEEDGEFRLVPIIPGSSIKGKIRSLLELKHATIYAKKPENNRDAIKIGDNWIKYETPESKMIPILFGTGAKDKSEEFNRSRLIFRDSVPTAETIKDWEQNEDIIEGGEVKGENTLNRITSAANPRFIERVPAGSVFDLEIILSIYENDNEEELKKKLEEGIDLLKDSYLGGSGSRGYGKIKIEKKSETIKASKDYIG